MKNKKLKDKAKKVSSALINDMGPMAAMSYAEHMMESVDMDEEHLDRGFMVYQLWEEVQAEIRKWEARN